MLPNNEIEADLHRSNSEDHCSFSLLWTANRVRVLPTTEIEQIFTNRTLTPLFILPLLDRPLCESTSLQHDDGEANTELHGRSRQKRFSSKINFIFSSMTRSEIYTTPSSSAEFECDMRRRELLCSRLT
ncbi:hypothetical protein L484_022046 [Morus notabilis]|uniref:Uncharacterized protein n=1 Tax=Morus notabilis TaxID=981085 RepID=W9RP78_9ROSA|nr:hypothetical protein L484_022046 [Morus notabilis]